MAGMFSTPQPPAVPPPVRQPTPEDSASKEAARQAQQQLIGMPGRDSTNLTGNNRQGYTGTVLGR